jgi:hypothetical protein
MFPALRNTYSQHCGTHTPYTTEHILPTLRNGTAEHILPTLRNTYSQHCGTHTPYTTERHRGTHTPNTTERHCGTHTPNTAELLLAAPGSVPTSMAEYSEPPTLSPLNIMVHSWPRTQILPLLLNTLTRNTAILRNIQSRQQLTTLRDTHSTQHQILRNL